MDRLIISCFIILFMGKMPPTAAQRSLQQYFHLSSLPYSTIQLPASAITSNAATSSPSSTQIPMTGLPSLAALSLPSMIVPTSQQQAEPCEVTSPKSSSIDGKLLNNLAIALQMLILSNILNSTPNEEDKCKKGVPAPCQVESVSNNILSSAQNAYNPSQISYNPTQNSYSPSQTSQSSLNSQLSYYQPQTTNSQLQTSNTPSQYTYSQTQNSYNPTQSTYNPTQNTYNPTQNTYNPTQNTHNPTQNQYFTTQADLIMPSTGLIGIPNFSEPKLEQNVRRTRGNFNLMSPYEALAQPYSDHSSSYMPSISRRDFQSPYAMIDTNVDFFPMNDLF